MTAIWRSFFQLSILSLKPIRYSFFSASMIKSMYCGAENGFGRRAILSNRSMQLETNSMRCKPIFSMASRSFWSTWIRLSDVSFFFNSASYFCWISLEEVKRFCTTYSHLYGLLEWRDQMAILRANATGAIFWECQETHCFASHFTFFVWNSARKVAGHVALVAISDVLSRGKLHFFRCSHFHFEFDVFVGVIVCGWLLAIICFFNLISSILVNPSLMSWCSPSTVASSCSLSSSTSPVNDSDVVFIVKSTVKNFSKLFIPICQKNLLNLLTVLLCPLSRFEQKKPELLNL